MNSTRKKLVTSPAAWLVIGFICVPLGHADDMVSFATGGYAAGLRTVEMMHAIDTNHDGTISREEWTAFQERMFAALDTDHSGTLDRKEFRSPDRERVAFATAAYVRGLETDDMFDKIDTDHDGTISRSEYLAYQQKIFDMMGQGKKESLGFTDWIRKGN